MRWGPQAGGDFISPVPPGSPEDPQQFKSSTEATLPDGSEIEFFLPGKTFPFGSNWVIPGGTMANELSASFTWSAASPEFPPDPAAAR